jgi:hypothetical protein
MDRKKAPWQEGSWRGRIKFVASSPWTIAAVIAGGASVMAMVALCHLLGFVSHNSEGVGYPFTNYLASTFSKPVVGIYLLLSGLLGAGFRRVWPVALGMMLPWPIACAIEVIRDPTSHNLLPFDIMLWCAAFAVGLMGAFVGRLIRSRMGETVAPRFQ